MRNKEYEIAKEELLSLAGVGPKVADCVLLMSLDKPGAIPVDTHVWTIAKRDYGFNTGTSAKTLTARNYQSIGDKFRQVFGEQAGWAHSVLFSAEVLKQKGTSPIKKEEVTPITPQSISKKRAIIETECVKEEVEQNDDITHDEVSKKNPKSQLGFLARTLPTFKIQKLQ